MGLKLLHHESGGMTDKGDMWQKNVSHKVD